jgi:hypothetical protein
VRAGGHGAKINGDGTASSVTITLLPQRAGLTSLQVCVDGAPVSLAPLPLTLTAGSLCLPRCTLRGGGGGCVAGVATRLVLQARDKHGNALRSGGAHLLAAAFDDAERGAKKTAH